MHLWADNFLQSKTCMSSSAIVHDFWTVFVSILLTRANISLMSRVSTVDSSISPSNPIWKQWRNQLPPQNTERDTIFLVSYVEIIYTTLEVPRCLERESGVSTHIYWSGWRRQIWSCRNTGTCHTGQVPQFAAHFVDVLQRLFHGNVVCSQVS